VVVSSSPRNLLRARVLGVRTRSAVSVRAASSPTRAPGPLARPKSSSFRSALRGHEDVGRLDVAVDEPAAGGAYVTASRPGGESEAAPCIELLSSQYGGRSGPSIKLHDEVREPVGGLGRRREPGRCWAGPGRPGCVARSRAPQDEVRVIPRLTSLTGHEPLEPLVAANRLVATPMPPGRSPPAAGRADVAAWMTGHPRNRRPGAGRESSAGPSDDLRGLQLGSQFRIAVTTLLRGRRRGSSAGSSRAAMRSRPASAQRSGVMLRRARG